MRMNPILNKDLDGKKVLVIGLGITGVSLVEFLARQKVDIIINDCKDEETLSPILEKLQDIRCQYILGKHPKTLKEAGEPDILIPSPGVPLDIPIISEAKLKKIPVIGEIELAYKHMQAPILAITGTNGKTTTTALVGDMVERAEIKTEIVGNIGTAAISKVEYLNQEAYCVMEVSSFQLETIETFRPKSAAVLNITPDHLNRHKSFEKYAQLKFDVFSNQTTKDYAVINADDDTCLQMLEKQEIKSKVILFSRLRELKEGIFLKEDKILIKEKHQDTIVIDRDRILLPGDHNLENAMAAIGLAWSAGVPLKAIRESLEKFKGVEHRIEMVDCIEEVTYINDSKATNPDATEKAVLSVKRPIILLAGGMDKKSNFEGLIDKFANRVKHLIVYGETADKLVEDCREKNFYSVTKTKDLEEAVRHAYQISHPGDAVLLSPACASWDMYRNYEERGNHFKRLVSQIKRK